MKKTLNISINIEEVTSHYNVQEYKNRCNCSQVKGSGHILGRARGVANFAI